MWDMPCTPCTVTSKRQSSNRWRCRAWPPAWVDYRGMTSNPLIEKHLGDLAIPVYVYETYHAGQPANEPGAG